MSEDESRSARTFLFADLAGFTALTEAHGDERAAAVAAGFCDRMRARAPDFGAGVVKSIGDAVLVQCERAADAIEFGLSVLDEEDLRADSPEVRIGMHTGSAVQRGDDWFGAAVNVAARVVAVAAAGELVLTSATVDAADRLEDIELERLGARRLKNVGEPVVLLRASRPGSHRGPAVVDPVCRMTVPEGEWIGSLTFEGRVFHFCSLDCASRFAADPERFADAAPG